MKKLFVCAVALGLFASAPTASAQDNSGHSDKRDAAAPDAAHASPSTDTHQNSQGHALKSEAHATKVDKHEGSPGGTVTDAVHTKSVEAYQNPPATDAAGNRYSPASHTADGARGNSGMSASTTRRHPSINSLRLNVQASRHFHGGSYSPPQGYRARHWSHGERLPRGYYARSYWLSDFLTFGLFMPPPGLVWVRVGDDALLVDEISGDIVQVDYGVFY